SRGGRVPAQREDDERDCCSGLLGASALSILSDGPPRLSLCRQRAGPAFAARACAAPSGRPPPPAYGAGDRHLVRPPLPGRSRAAVFVRFGAGLRARKG